MDTLDQNVISLALPRLENSTISIFAKDTWSVLELPAILFSYTFIVCSTQLILPHLLFSEVKHWNYRLWNDRCISVEVKLYTCLTYTIYYTVALTTISHTQHFLRYILIFHVTLLWCDNGNVCKSCKDVDLHIY